MQARQCESSSTKEKRKKYVTRIETIEVLKDKKHQITEVCRDITKILCPFEFKEDDTDVVISEKKKKLEQVAQSLIGRVGKLSKDFKNKKFRKEPERLEEKFVSCSQYSILQSQESLEDEDQNDDSYNEIESDETDSDDEPTEDNRPRKYKKKPLNSRMSKQARRKRVKPMKVLIEKWAQEEGVTPCQLLGKTNKYLVNYANY